MPRKTESEGGFVYRKDPIAEPRETFRLSGGPTLEDIARREALQAERLANAQPVTQYSRETLRIRTIIPAIVIGEVVDDKKD